MGIAIGAVPFVLTLWDYGLDPLRAALPSRIFSNFFDTQAESFLRGDLAVPTGSLGIEGFRHDGHEYMYFTPFPAILRLPVAALTQTLDGRLTAPSMLLAWTVGAIFLSLTVWRIRSMVTPGRALGRGDLIAGAGFMVVVLGGSPLLLLAATPWVYTEALMWAFAMTVGALYALLGVLQEPSGARILATAVLTLGAVLSRVTAGWGCGLAVLGVGLLMAFSPRRRRDRSASVWIMAAGAIPLMIGIGINIAKFDHPLFVPYHEHVWSAQSLERQAVLADGGLIGLRFLPTTLFNYLRPDGLRLSAVFPFLSPPAEPAPTVAGVMLDMRYRTPSATGVMPMLFILAVVGVVVIARPGAAIGRASLRIPVLGALSISTGVLLLGHIAPRYVVEFLPVLVVAGAAGLFASLATVEAWSRRRRLVVGAGVVVLALFGAAANAATALVSSRTTAGGSALRDYVEWQRRVSDLTGGPLDEHITVGDVVPTYSVADELFIVGGCRALLLGTGELYRPWLVLDVAPVHVTAQLSGEFEPGQVDVVRFDGSDDAAVSIESDGDGSYRVVTRGTRRGYTESPWKSIDPGTTIGINAYARVDWGRYVIEVPGHVFTETSLVRRLPKPRADVVLSRAVAPLRGPIEGLEVTIEPSILSPLCTALLDSVGRDP